MKLKFFTVAKKMAEYGDHHTYRVGAALVKKNRVVGTGFNKYKTHPASPSPYKHIHAEVAAVLSASDATGADIYVFRQTRNNTLGMSKPCKWCEAFLRTRNVRAVHYSTEEGYATYVL